jgi:predicted NAD/FAD-binding protein
MLRDVQRFNREARVLARNPDEKVALGDFLCGAGYSQDFVRHYVVPMGAAIWSAAPESFLRFPAVTFARFFENHGLLEASPSLPWRVVCGGSQLATAVGSEHFDRVVLAVHSPQALRLLVDPSGLERVLLGAIGTQENEVLLHTDRSLLPRSRRAWASWNYRIPHSPQERVLVTYDMSRLQSIDSSTRFLVTLNGGARIDPRRVLGRFVVRHPVFDAAAVEAGRRRGELSGRSRTHYCGAWWGHGFHEDGVRSAVEACAELGAEL